jgi:hypothetical protein
VPQADALEVGERLPGRDREREKRERCARVVVEPPDQAEVEQREARASGVSRTFPRCGSAW